MKQFQKGGNGELVALGTLPDDERKELLEDRLSQVNQVIDQYEAIHISSQTGSQIAAALQVLHEQNLVLVKAADEEQLVDRCDIFTSILLFVETHFTNSTIVMNKKRFSWFWRDLFGLSLYMKIIKQA